MVSERTSIFEGLHVLGSVLESGSSTEPEYIAHAFEEPGRSVLDTGKKNIEFSRDTNALNIQKADVIRFSPAPRPCNKAVWM